jgi:hypothetical protein
MPIKCKKGKVRYRAKKIKDSKKYVRLAFCGNKVVEAKVKSYKKLRRMV